MCRMRSDDILSFVLSLVKGVLCFRLEFWDMLGSLFFFSSIFSTVYFSGVYPSPSIIYDISIRATTTFEREEMAMYGTDLVSGHFYPF